ncbi:hypothetical protein AOLI_G00046840 [Acnodon oligacanthus]
MGTGRADLPQPDPLRSVRSATLSRSLLNAGICKMGHLRMSDGAGWKTEQLLAQLTGINSQRLPEQFLSEVRQALSQRLQEFLELPQRDAAPEFPSLRVTAAVGGWQENRGTLLTFSSPSLRLFEDADGKALYAVCVKVRNLRNLAEDIEDSFQDNEKAGVVFLDLIDAYDSVWHRRLHLKLLWTVPDRHMALEDGLIRDRGILADYFQRGQDSGCSIPPQQSGSKNVYVGKNCPELQHGVPLGWIDLGRFSPVPSHIHASPCPTRSRIVYPCLERKSTCEQVLAGIAPASLRRDAATLTLARKAQKYDWHILHKATITSAPSGRLKSHHSYNKAAQKMLQCIPEDLSRDAWLAATRKQMLETAGSSCIQQYIRDPGGGAKGEDLPRHLWTLLNHLHTAASSHR